MHIQKQTFDRLMAVKRTGKETFCRKEIAKLDDNKCRNYDNWLYKLEKNGHVECVKFCRCEGRRHTLYQITPNGNRALMKMGRYLAKKKRKEARQTTVKKEYNPTSQHQISYIEACINNLQHCHDSRGLTKLGQKFIRQNIRNLKWQLELIGEN